MRHRLTIAVATATLVPLLLLSACVGIKARNEVLLPTMSKAWPMVFDLIKAAGPSDDILVQSARMESALKSGDYQRVLAVDWPALEVQARAGIQILLDSGEIGHGTSLSLTELVDRFSSSFLLLQKRQ